MIIFTILVAASLACSLPGSTPTLPPTAQPMSTAQIQNLETQVITTLQSPNEAGEVSITLTQDQINGILTSQMAQQPDQVISDPSVVLTGGHLELYGKITQSGVTADLKVVMQPEVDASGNPRLSITSINLGGLPVPDVLKNQVEELANNALANAISSNSTKFKIKSINITEGQMTLTGTRQ
jgi:hypothetical protein